MFMVDEDGIARAVMKISHWGGELYFHFLWVCTILLAGDYLSAIKLKKGKRKKGKSWISLKFLKFPIGCQAPYPFYSIYHQDQYISLQLGE